MVVYLVPIRNNRFELYSEPPAETVSLPQGEGRLARWAHRAGERWRDVVDVARSSTPTGRLIRWRDSMICRLADTLDHQRALWALGRHDQATLLFPATVPVQQARAVLDQTLAAARRHHGLWVAIDVPVLILAGVLTPIPGPNVIAYYLAFRVVGHFLSWRGARRSLNTAQMHWTLKPDESLAELCALVDVPRHARGPRVDAIARRLNLHHLSAFFERAAL